MEHQAEYIDFSGHTCWPVLSEDNENQKTEAIRLSINIMADMEDYLNELNDVLDHLSPTDRDQEQMAGKIRAFRDVVEEFQGGKFREQFCEAFGYKEF